MPPLTSLPMDIDDAGVTSRHSAQCNEPPFVMSPDALRGGGVGVCVCVGGEGATQSHHTSFC